MPIVTALHAAPTALRGVGLNTAASARSMGMPTKRAADWSRWRATRFRYTTDAMAAQTITDARAIFAFALSVADRFVTAHAISNSSGSRSQTPNIRTAITPLLQD